MHKWNYNSKLLIKTFNGKVIGNENIIIDSVTTVNDLKENSILFFTKKKWSDEFLNKIHNIKNCFVIIEPDLLDFFSEVSTSNCIVITENARLYFAKALITIINSKNDGRDYKKYGLDCIIGENVYIGKGCIIEPFVFIDHDVSIGNNVTIKSGTKIRQNVVIKDNAVIGENSVIGAQGFGIEKDENENNIRIPHIGGVLIKENVEIGALTSIVAGTIHPTVIEKNVFIDDLNHIAHNCSIGEGTLTTAAVQIGGSVIIGANSYIAPNATIRNGISLGESCFIGQASSVQKSFGNNVSLVGNPSKQFEKKD